MKTLPLIACLLMLCGACKQQKDPAAPIAKVPAPAAEREGSGQVFVATKGGNTVKLGGVPVLLFSAEVVAAKLTEVRSNSVAGISRGLERLRAAEAAQVKTKAARAVTAKPLATASMNLNNMLARTKATDLAFFDTRDRLQAELQGFADRHDAVALADEQAKQAVSAAESEVLRHTPTAHLLKAKWPTPDFKSTTDADGNFSARLPAGREFVAVVFASRLVGDTQERYAWVQTVPANVRLLLSNENRFSE
jgi:hypothetical protein